MAKTFEDYMGDSQFGREPMGLRVTHAMRAVVQDKIDGMTTAEEVAYLNESARATMSGMGTVPKYAKPYDEDA